MAGGRGAAPPRTPLHSRGLRPPDTPKGAPRPRLQRLFALSRPNHLSGAELFFKNRIVFCPGQLRCLGQNFSQKNGLLFEQATCPGQLRCLGQNFFSQKSDFFFEQTTCPGQLRCLGQNFFSKYVFFLNKPLVPGSFAA